MGTVWNLVGRLHPVLVHLPIGTLVLLGALEVAGLLSPKLKLNRPIRGVIVISAAACALATTLCGWVLARQGDYDPTLVSRHQNLGLITATLSVALVLLHRLAWRRTYGTTLILALIALGATGHIGGSLTHGENYLTFARPAPTTALPTDPQALVVYSHLIHPIIEQRCVSCHGPAKSNGELQLHSWEAFQKGGEHGAAVVAGDASRSLMMERIFLPIEAKLHMPPKGKPQLTDEEITLLTWWIDAGALPEAKVSELAPSAAVDNWLAIRFPDSREPAMDWNSVLKIAATLEAKVGVIIRQSAADRQSLQINARLASPVIGDTQLAELSEIAFAIESLDLGETNVTDTGLTHLKTMRNLRRLHLDRTQITDTGLQHLSALSRLEVLNLHTTAVSDAGLAHLAGLRRLKALHVWQTNVTREASNRLAEKLNDHRRLRRWRDQAFELNNKIMDHTFFADHGESIAPSNLEARVPPAPPVK